MLSITFNGELKLISFVESDILQETYTVSMKNIYSRWKEWCLTSDNAKYHKAIDIIGGNPLFGGQSLGVTYFLTNNWKIRPMEVDHNLVIQGNVYDESGGTILLKGSSSANVLVSIATSNLIDQVNISGSTAPTVEQIRIELDEYSTKLFEILKQAKMAVALSA